jgi:hypothetical protein
VGVWISYGTISGKWEIWGAESRREVKGQLCSRDGVFRAWQGSNSGDASTLHIFYVQVLEIRL